MPRACSSGWPPASYRLDTAARAERPGSIEDARTGLVPLVVPVTPIRHSVNLLDGGDLAGQTYLEPHPGSSCSATASETTAAALERPFRGV